MDPACALLDRELLHSAVVHELAGALTALHGFIELDELRASPSLVSAAERMGSLVATLRATPVAVPFGATFRGVPVRVTGPLDVLEIALAAIPRLRLTVELLPEHVVVLIEGVPRAEQSAGWRLTDVQAWLANGGPGLAGARLRIAARIVGALRYHFVAPPEADRGVVSIHLARQEI